MFATEHHRSFKEVTTEYTGDMLVSHQQRIDIVCHIYTAGTKTGNAMVCNEVGKTPCRR